MRNETSVVVVKFGGTSVAGLSQWKNIAKIVKAHVATGKRLLIVCSAMAGVSNKLESLLLGADSAQRKSILKELIAQHEQLQQELQVKCDYLPKAYAELEKLIEGICLVGEVTPRLHARIMAFGELLLTQLGAAYLQQQELQVHWQDAREWLKTETERDFRHPDVYLNARCSSQKDEALLAKFNSLPQAIVITQGFIAANAKEETVLLGRGGSDSSAAYFAAKLAASVCEIWTDVPGIYTANPKQIPQAKLLTILEYDEAQEIASMGAKVLHPNCIAPVRQANIPLFVKYTGMPERQGTEITALAVTATSQIKSILTKQHIVLITIETVNMWQQVGFLARVFQIFKQHGISIDLISTSEFSVTVTLDSLTQTKDASTLDGLLLELNEFARATVIAPCASVSLVGKNIRSILHQLGGVFTVFEEKKIYLLSQAANDLNLTFVVDEDQAPRLAAELHHLLIEQRPLDERFHLSWQEEFGAVHNRQSTPFWQKQRELLLQLAKRQSPVYVYAEKVLRAQAQALKQCDAIDAIYYSLKANPHPEILRIFYHLGLGFECVSIQELMHVLDLFPKIERKRISFTPNFAAKNEYEQALSLGVHVTVDSIYPLSHWGSIFAGAEILIRVDLGKGSGHHKYVVTGGDQSKFGIPLNELDLVAEIAKTHQIHIKGLHSHAGSGILNALHWQTVLRGLLNVLQQFPEVTWLNLGGGLGIAEHATQESLDLGHLNASILTVKQQHPNLKLWLEPGRYLVAEAGVLLAKVTQVKSKGSLTFVGIETGMNSLIRPALYGAYHEIVNLTRLHEPPQKTVNIVGPICESGDTLGYSRCLPACHEGDVMLIANVGAYGHSMSSFYNMRPAAEEYLLTQEEEV